MTDLPILVITVIAALLLVGYLELVDRVSG
jgi:hypothetical protein